MWIENSELTRTALDLIAKATKDPDDYTVAYISGITDLVDELCRKDKEEE